MPCRSDYLAASGQELESKRVCSLIIYLYKKLGMQVPAWVLLAVEEYYGNTARLDEATKMLCECCRSLTNAESEQYIYDAHSKVARDLASWWERHLEWDARRVKEEDETRKRIVAKERGLKKLTVEEMEALGLKENA